MRSRGWGGGWLFRRPVGVEKGVETGVEKILPLGNSRNSEKWGFGSRLGSRFHARAHAFTLGLRFHAWVHAFTLGFMLSRLGSRCHAWVHASTLG